MSIAETLEPMVQTPPPKQRIHSNEALYENAPSDVPFEIVDGRIVEKEMSSVEKILANVLHEMLYEHLKTNSTGRVWSETMFAIPGSQNDRQPDLAYVSFDTWPKNQAIPRVNALPFVPDLTVEVVSPSDKMFDVFSKMQEYFHGGVKSVWLILSHLQLIQCYTSMTAVRIFTSSEELTDEPTLPGLRLGVASVFPKVDES